MIPKQRWIVREGQRLCPRNHGHDAGYPPIWPRYTYLYGLRMGQGYFGVGRETPASRKGGKGGDNEAVNDEGWGA